jgi:hypothetical protein
MRLKEVVLAQKKNIKWGEWQSGHVPRKDFPLSKHRNKVYSLGPSHQSRICQFSIGDQDFRVWIVYRLDLEKYCAYLGEERDGDMHVLCRYEFHGTHECWHVHAACREDASAISPGRTSPPGLRRLPDGKAKHRSVVFDVTTNDRATLIAADAFGLHRQAGDEANAQNDLFV